MKKGFLETEVDIAFAEFARVGDFELLGETDRVIVAVWALDGEVNNGGFEQFYFNSSGDYAYFVPSALNLINANQTAEIVQEANQEFGPQGPSRNRDDRQELLELLSADEDERLFDSYDKRFYSCHDNLDVLLTEFVSARKRK